MDESVELTLLVVVAVFVELADVVMLLDPLGVEELATGIASLGSNSKESNRNSPSLPAVMALNVC